MVASAVSRGLSDCFTAYQAFTEELKVKFMLSLYAKKSCASQRQTGGLGYLGECLKGQQHEKETILNAEVYNVYMKDLILR